MRYHTSASASRRTAGRWIVGRWPSAFGERKMPPPGLLGWSLGRRRWRRRQQDGRHHGAEEVEEAAREPSMAAQRHARRGMSPRVFWSIHHFLNL
jgi:hypothetical protein